MISKQEVICIGLCIFILNVLSVLPCLPRSRALTGIIVYRHFGHTKSHDPDIIRILISDHANANEKGIHQSF